MQLRGAKKKDFKTSWRVIIHYTSILYHGFFICSKITIGGGNTCTYNEYMHIAQALRTLIIEDKKSVRRFYGSRLPNYQSVTIYFL